MTKGKRAKQAKHPFFGGHHVDIRRWRTAYQCDCGWTCERGTKGVETVIKCPVCKAPKTMSAVAGYLA